MIRDDVVALIAWRLGNRKDMNERIIAEMKLAQQIDLEQAVWRPWFLEKALASTTLPAGDSSLPLPDDFLAEAEDAALWLGVSQTEAFSVRKESLSDLPLVIPSASYPTAYAIADGELVFNSTGTADLQVFWRYAAKSADITQENVETPWLRYAPDLVIAIVGGNVAQKHLQNPAQAQSFLSDRVEAQSRLLGLDTAQREINQVRAMGRRT